MLWTMYVDFFFSSRRRHTRYIGDWSSDVCSSDLVRSQRAGNIRVEPGPNVTCHVGSEPVQLVHPWKHLRDEPQPAQRKERTPPERKIEIDFVDFEEELAEAVSGATAQRLEGRG